MNVHFMAVPANRMVAVDIPVTVYKILHVCSATKWCRCFFPPKRERAIVRSFHDEIL